MSLYSLLKKYWAGTASTSEVALLLALMAIGGEKWRELTSR